MKKRAIFLMGPTASGKTDLAVSLSKLQSVAIISVDSAMIYRGLDIGSGKPTADVLHEAPHALVDILEPYESYSVAEFCVDVEKLMEQAYQANKIPLLVGGTMMYFYALQHGLSNTPASDETIRVELMQRFNSEGLAGLYEELRAVDEVTAARLKPNDSQRIIRALEVYQTTGKSISMLQAARTKVLQDWELTRVGLFPNDRKELHARIAKRFHNMLAEGFVEEVESLYSNVRLHSRLQSMRSVGYRQVWAYLDGKLSYEDMCNKAIAATRQLAKRQITWLRSWQGLQVFDPFVSDLLNKLNCTLFQNAN